MRAPRTAHRRSPCASPARRASMPFTSGISIGEGMNSMMASSIACTPLFLNAEPHMHSTISPRSERSRKPAPDLRLGQRARPRDTCAAAPRCPRPPPRSSWRDTHRPRPAGSAGMSRYSKRHALGLHVPVDRLHADQIDHALEALLGADRQSGRERDCRAAASRICSTQRRKFAPARSILLTKAMRGTP